MTNQLKEFLNSFSLEDLEMIKQEKIKLQLENGKLPDIKITLEELIENLKAIDLTDIFYDSTLIEKELLNFDFSILKANDLKEFAPILGELTNGNCHMQSLLLVAYIVNDLELIKAAQAIKKLDDARYYVKIIHVRHEVANFIMSVGEKKFGKESWKEYIYYNL